MTPTLYRLVYAATLLGLGHHVDHAIRGNHVGWPLIERVTPFTFSLAIYPTVAVGLYLARRGRVGPGYWAVAWGAIGLLVAFVHLPLTAEAETTGDIVRPYSSAILGWAAFVWLLILGCVVAATAAYATYLWRRERRFRGERTPAASREWESGRGV